MGMSLFDVSGRLGHGAALELAYQPPWAFTPWLRPHAGAMLTSAGRAYGYLGLQLPVSIRTRGTVAPTFAVGAYGKGRSVDLGNVVQFRSGVELELRSFGQDSIVLFFYHLSNAGLGDWNPGMEVIGLAYLIKP